MVKMKVIKCPSTKHLLIEMGMHKESQSFLHLIYQKKKKKEREDIKTGSAHLSWMRTEAGMVEVLLFNN